MAQTPAVPPADLNRAHAFIQVCWAACKPDKRAARRMFREQWHGKKIERVDGLLRKWCERESVFPIPKPGRRPIIDDALAKAAAAIYVRGWADEYGTVRGFRNVEHALAKSESFTDLVGGIKCSPLTVLAAMKRVCPEVGRVRQRVKHVLSDKLKLERRRAAGVLLRMPLYVRKATEWMDEGGFGLHELSEMVWGDKTKGERLVTDNRAPRTKDDYTVLHYCVTVNWAVGPHTLTYLTGTKGMGEETFKARGLGALTCAASRACGTRSSHVSNVSPRRCSAPNSSKGSVLHMRKE